MPNINECPSCLRPMSSCKCGGLSGGSGGGSVPENVDNAIQRSTYAKTTQELIEASGQAGNTETRDNDAGFPLIELDPENLTITLSMNNMSPQAFKECIDKINTEIKAMIGSGTIQGDIHIVSDSTDKVVIKCSDAKTYKSLLEHLSDLKLLPGVNPESVTKAIEKIPCVNQTSSEPPGVNDTQPVDQDEVNNNSSSVLQLSY